MRLTMQQVIQMVSEIYMIVLCLLTGPADQKEMYIDQVSTRGLMDTLIVQRTDQGFTVYDERSGHRVPFVTLQRQAGKPGVFIAKGPNGREEVVDLSAESASLETLNARQQGKQILKLKGGSEVQIARSGGITYVNELRSDRTYVVHREEPLTEKTGSLNAEATQSAVTLTVPTLRAPQTGAPTAVQQITRVYALRYAQASRLSSLIQPILGESGRVANDERSNSVIVTAPKDLQAGIARLIEELDVKPK